ncbi:domain 2 of Leucyl-tRNA synthetase, partial [Helicosporidium sp. ATCC 50920]
YWQGYWESTGSFITPQFALLDTSKPKYYVLDMFPYPSGSGLHVGHPSGYTATDVVARYKRARGYNVLHPMGWDAFGLPAEQYAMATGTHPAASTRDNVARFRGQLRRLGLSYDWSRELSTAEPEYYRWTQHAFLSALRRGLAYRREAPVNWCPALGTVLANEEVVQGRSERGNHPVQRLPMKQWMLAITRHAERLLRGLSSLDWDSHVLDMQRNWIGRSEGALVEFEVERGGGERAGSPSSAGTLSAFTTRPDTLFGATYVAVAPEHPSALLWTTADRLAEVEAYVAAAASKSDLERAEAAAGKSGVWTGSWARHPATGELLPLWVADYVLGGVGTGALMGVPSHDLRDAAFAEAFDLPFRAVVEDADGDDASGKGRTPPADPRPDRVYTGVAGRVKDSRSPDGSLCADGMSVPEAQRAVVAWLQARGRGRHHVQYKLRDWLFARQRYWGEPFPVAYEQLADGSLAEEPSPLAEDSLPLRLPPLSDFRPTGTPEGPLSKLQDWVRTSLPGSENAPRPALRETSTMPQWAGSCWYFLRFVDPWNASAPADPDAQRYWLPVDLYVGGAEHAVLHLLYARFWQQMLFDAGAATCEEPFQKLVSQGMVLGEVEYTAPCLAAEGAEPLAHGGAWDLDAVRPLSPEEEAANPHAVPVRVPADLVRADGAGGFCLASR